MLNKSRGRLMEEKILCKRNVELFALKFKENQRAITF